MRLISTLVIFLLLYISHGEAYSQYEKEKWLVEESSSMKVKGSSNVNNFTCIIEGQSNKDTLSIDYSEGYGKIKFVQNEVLINAGDFDCGHAMITSDMKKTLQADQHPYIILRFLSVEKPTFKNFSTQSVKGDISITIAGHSNRYSIIYKMTPRTDGTILLLGEKKISIKDFKLETPSKLFGMIKVDDEIDVNFNMALKQLL